MCDVHNKMLGVLKGELAERSGHTAGATALLRDYEARDDGLSTLKAYLSRRFGSPDGAVMLHKRVEAARGNRKPRLP